MQKTIYDLKAKAISGEEVLLSKYKDKVLLIVNTASKCGLTPQYKDLEELYQEYKDQGFAVLGFPCNQFANQEPKSNQAIKHYCLINYGVTFDMFEKIKVNGKDTHLVFKFLKDNTKSLLTKRIKWNFTKFLVDKNGVPYKRYKPTLNPKELKKDIEKLLLKK